ncbi:hypothetical protein DFH05DRAFT_1391641 [Lentinula detonsa]|uniref:Uncharacterized protein n=1 Tax=Lentinula detonsa TaxID=2804962 RepID=A0A9W8P5L6_9AGAR|nr:hypothetical protein DFH05DRAFT_1391641 [Lentinula detonsa]
MSQSNKLTPSYPSLERYRLDGMILDGFTFGIYTILTIYAVIAIMRGRGTHSKQGKVSKTQCYILLSYVVVTFLLGAVGFAANARYTEDIWINFRGQPGWSPEELITNEFFFGTAGLQSTGILAIMVWIMNALLLYRCVVTWNYARWVIFLMSTVYLAIVALSTSVMVFAQKQAIFTNLDLQLSFLTLSCTYNILYTALVAAKILSVQQRVKHTLSAEYAQIYTSVVTIIVESAFLYFIFDLLFLISFAIHSDTEYLILLENCLIQGIAQLLIIIRVAQGREHAQHATVSSDSSVAIKHSTLASTTTVDQGTPISMKSSIC